VHAPLRMLVAAVQQRVEVTYAETTVTDPLVPITDLTRHYLRLKSMPSAGRLTDAEETSATGLAHEFNEGAAAFRDFSARGQWFYDGDPNLRDVDKNEKSESRTYGWAMSMTKQGHVVVDGGGDLDFACIDREINPTRAKPALRFDAEDGASLRIDLLLANVHSGRPIVGELKISSDKDPYTGLIQALAAAAQMTPRGQRARLLEHSEREGLSHRLPSPLAGVDEEQLIDVYVLLAEFPERGRDRFQQLELAADLARELEGGSMPDGLGRIRILTLTKDPDGLVRASSDLPRPQ
jgi:hypothetical protein